ncbi:hypothetical protein [Psychromonas arctica]|uniref:hypothetical protein n=1 Tax=Psychromonas arctica TaxID=168275 RepID=UPI00048FF6E1|nr:hypothetical protein [Psychromonas arctica]
MNEQDVSNILELANLKLSNHPSFEEGLGFDGAKVLPTGMIVPTYPLKSCKCTTLSDEIKISIYQEVWKETAIELGL